MEQAGLELIARGASAFEQDLAGGERAINDFARSIDDGASGFGDFERGAGGASKGLDGLASVAGGAAGIISGALVGGILAAGSALAEVSEKAAIVERALGDLGSADMSAVLNDAALLEARYGVELPEAVGAASTLMDEFGLTSEQAMDFIVDGYAKGMDASGDFLDSIGEYSNLFADNGFAAEEFFSTMQTGMAGGVLGTDKAADAFKEFGIRIQEVGDDLFGPDGGLNQLFSPDEMTALFDGLQDGSVTVADAYDMIMPRLAAMDNPIHQNALGVKLFGTQWEDLGASAILAIDTTMTGMDDMAAGADESRGRIESLGEIWPRIWGGFVAALEPANEAILNFINAIGGDTEALAALPGWAQDLVGAVQGIPGVIDGAKAKIDEFFNTPLGTMLKDGATDVASYFSGPFQEDLNNGIALAEAGLNRIAESDFGKRLQAGAGVVANYFVNEWPADFQNGIALVEGYLAPLAPEAERIFTEAKQGAELIASYILDEWPTDFQNGVDLVVDFVTKLPERAQTAFDDFKKRLAELPAQLLADAQAIGESIVDGIADGISNAAGRAIQAARDLASSLPEWVQKVLGIASPSKVFADEVGMPISQGIAEGILAGIDATLAAGAELTDELLKQMTSAAEQAREILDGVLSGQIGLSRGGAAGIGLLAGSRREVEQAAARQARAQEGMAKVEAERLAAVAAIEADRQKAAEESARKVAELEAQRAGLEVTAAQNLDPQKRIAAAEQLAELERKIAAEQAKAAEADLAARQKAADADQKAAERRADLQADADAATMELERAKLRNARIEQQLAEAQQQANELAATDPQEAARFLALRQRQIAELDRLQSELDSATTRSTQRLIADQIALVREAQAGELEQFRIESGRRIADLIDFGQANTFSPLAPVGTGDTSNSTTNSITINGTNFTIAQLTQLIRSVLAEQAATATNIRRMV
jgi:hypothetical protein